MLCRLPAWTSGFPKACVRLATTSRYSSEPCDSINGFLSSEFNVESSTRCRRKTAKLLYSNRCSSQLFKLMVTSGQIRFIRLILSLCCSIDCALCQNARTCLQAATFPTFHPAFPQPLSLLPLLTSKLWDPSETHVEMLSPRTVKQSIGEGIFTMDHETLPRLMTQALLDVWLRYLCAVLRAHWCGPWPLPTTQRSGA